MKAWIVRFVSLYVFNVVVLLAIGLLTPARVGWAALWAGVLLTAATLWLKPLIAKAFEGAAARAARSGGGLARKLVSYGVVLVVELIIWILVVVFSRVSVHGFFWGWVLPPVLLLIAWAIYDAVDDRLEARAGALYDSASRLGSRGSTADQTRRPAPPAAPADPAARAEAHDGLTPEQRKMLDDLS